MQILVRDKIDEIDDNENKTLDLSDMEEKLTAAAQKCRKSTVVTLWQGGTTTLTQTNAPPATDGTPGAKTYHLKTKEGTNEIDITHLTVPKQKVRAQIQVLLYLVCVCICAVAVCAVRVCVLVFLYCVFVEVL